MMLNHITFGNPVNTRSGGKNVYFGDKVTLEITGTVPFGVQEYKNMKQCDIQIKDQSILSFFEDFDKLIISEASKNSFKWFSKSIHNSVISELYRSPLKKNKDYPPLLRVKFDKNSIMNGDILKGCTVKMTVDTSGLYFTSGSFGSSWAIRSYTITQTAEPKLSGYSFIEEE